MNLSKWVRDLQWDHNRHQCFNKTLQFIFIGVSCNLHLWVWPWFSRCSSSWKTGCLWLCPAGWFFGCSKGFCSRNPVSRNALRSRTQSTRLRTPRKGRTSFLVCSSRTGRRRIYEPSHSCHQSHPPSFLILKEFSV